MNKQTHCLHGHLFDAENTYIKGNGTRQCRLCHRQWARERYHRLQHPSCIPTPEQRFWAKVDKSGECWLWTGKMDRTGYGLFKVNKREVRVHRFSYELAYGSLLPSLLVCHKCDTRACVRPEHLFVGSHRDNTQDMCAKGRKAVLRGVAHPYAKLREDDVRAIRTYAAGGLSQVKIARLFGVAPTTIQYVMEGRTWRHVQ